MKQRVCFWRCTDWAEGTPYHNKVIPFVGTLGSGVVIDAVQHGWPGCWKYNSICRLDWFPGVGMIFICRQDGLWRKCESYGLQIKLLWAPTPVEVSLCVARCIWGMAGSYLYEKHYPG